MTGILSSMSNALGNQNPNNPKPKPLGVTPQPNNVSGTAFRSAEGNVPTSTAPQAQPPSLAKNVANNLNANSLLMKSAAAQGERAAAARGLQNSTLGAEAAQRAMIDAALPIAQTDTQNQFASQQANLDREHQIAATRLSAELSHNNAMKELGAQVSANTIGKSIDFAMQIANNFDAQIAGILNNTQMQAKDKETAINSLKASRDSEVKFMTEFMQKIPTTKQNWAAFPELGVPAIRMT